MLANITHTPIVHVMTHTTFLPTTLGAWAAVIASILSGAAALFGYKNRRHINRVEVLVNGRLTAALKDIANLKAEAGVPERRVTDKPLVTPKSSMRKWGRNAGTKDAD